MDVPSSLIIRRTLYLIAGVIVVFALIGIGFYYFYHSSTSTSGIGSALLPNNTYLLLSSNEAPFNQVREIDLATGSTSPVSLSGIGNSQIISEGKSASSTVTYYLLSQPGAYVTNLYKKDSSLPKVGLQQLTFSPTYKYDLSVDPLTGSVAYAVSTPSASAPKSSQVMAYSSITKKETSLGAGNNPTILSGGGFVVYEQAANLVSSNTDTGKTYTVFPVSSSTPFAVDNTNNIIATYNAQGSKILFFSIANQVSASYTRFVKVATSTTPVALVYGEGNLYMISSTMANQKTQFKLSNVDASSFVMLPPLISLSEGEQLSIHHE